MSENGFNLLLHLIDSCMGVGIQAWNYFLCVLKALICCLLVSTGIGKKSSTILALDSFWETYLFSISLVLLDLLHPRCFEILWWWGIHYIGHSVGKLNGHSYRKFPWIILSSLCHGYYVDINILPTFLIFFLLVYLLLFFCWFCFTFLIFSLLFSSSGICSAHLLLDVF